MNRRRRQQLKFYRYCIKQARQLMRSELRKCEILGGDKNGRNNGNNGTILF